MTVHLGTYRLEGLQDPSDSKKILEEISPFLLIAIPKHCMNSIASLPVRAILCNMSGFATPKTVAFSLCFIVVNLHRLSSSSICHSSIRLCSRNLHLSSRFGLM